jgi:hypothetical protein
VTRRAQLVLGLLALATLVGLVTAQRLKGRPADLRAVYVAPFFSPNGDGRRDTMSVSFRLADADEVGVTILDADRRTVRRLAVDEPVPARRRARFRWDGRTATGALAPRGTYRVRVGLRRRDRTIDLVATTRLRVARRAR